MIHPAVRERPILFSGPMVRAILYGRKTQTRRVMKPQPSMSLVSQSDGYPVAWYEHGGEGPYQVWSCPYGVPGDRLWVREAFYVQPELWAENHLPQPIHYAASTSRDQVEDYILKPSIHMPRWASRIVLEVTDVRVQRVQEISLEDCLAEGIDVPGRERMLKIGPIKRECDDAHCRAYFRTLWDSLNAKRGFGWALNPWVWATSFRRVS